MSITPNLLEPQTQDILAERAGKNYFYLKSMGLQLPLSEAEQRNYELQIASLQQKRNYVAEQRGNAFLAEQLSKIYKNKQQYIAQQVKMQNLINEEKRHDMLSQHAFAQQSHKLDQYEMLELKRKQNIFRLNQIDDQKLQKTLEFQKQKIDKIDEENSKFEQDLAKARLNQRKREFLNNREQNKRQLVIDQRRIETFREHVVNQQELDQDYITQLEKQRTQDQKRKDLYFQKLDKQLATAKREAAKLKQEEGVKKKQANKILQQMANSKSQ